MRLPRNHYNLVAHCFLKPLVLLLISTSAINANDISGLVVGITDGDTLTLLVSGNRQVKIRLAEIDAPERGQPYGTKSKAALSDLVFSKTVVVQNTSRDRYGRIVGRVHTKSTDITAELVRLGAAWVFTRYATDPALPSLQKKARHDKRGLWELENPIPPWEWRRGKRSPGFSVKDQTSTSSCAIKGNINRKGDRIFHLPGTRDYTSTVIDTSRDERWFCSEAEARQAGWRAPR